jgi:hypothetical protein
MQARENRIAPNAALGAMFIVSVTIVGPTYCRAGDRFAVLRVAQKDGGESWRLACTFDGEPEGVSRQRPLQDEL